MLLGHVQDMIQRLAANRRKRQPRSKKEKMLDLLGRDRAGHPTRREELPPETVERVKAEIREETRRERRRKRIIGWIMVILALGAAIYLLISYLNYSPEGFLGGGQFEIDETNKLREALRRHHFEAETVKDTTEAFAVLKAIAERERPEIVSFGDSETMHATGIVGWLRGDGRWKLLDGFDPAMSYPERLEIRRQALMSDLFITGVNAISMEGSLHWLDKVGNRIAPVAFGPRKVVIVAGRNKIVADRAQAEDRIRTIAAPQNVARHPGFRTPCARTGVCSDCNSPDRVCNTRMEMLRCWPAGRVLVVLIDQELGL